MITLPRITTRSAFCTVEYLMPLIYQINRRCYSGPLTRNDLVLVSCTNSKIVLNSDVLAKCFNQHGTLVCPESVTRRSQDRSWIGLPWSPGSTVTYSRTHKETTCEDTNHLYHLGGRYFLSTRKQTIRLNHKPFKMSPLAVYHIPCNLTSDVLLTGFGTCPKQLTITLPIFRKKTVKYVPWHPSETNNNTIQLHYKSLKVPPPLHFNKTVINALDKTFHRINGDLASKLQTIRKDIKKLHEESGTPLATALAITALCISMFNLTIFIIICCYDRRHRQAQPDADLVRYVKSSTTLKEDPTVPMTVTCPDCGEEEPTSV